MRSRRRIAAVCGWLCLLGVPARADRGRWYKNAEWWARTAVIAGAIVADDATTCHNLAHGAIETNWPLQGSRSCLAINVKGAAVFTFYMGANWLSERGLRNNPSPKLGFASRWAVPIVAGVIHGQAAAHNAALAPVVVH